MRKNFVVLLLSGCLAGFSCPAFAGDRGGDCMDPDRPGPECMGDDKMDAPPHPDKMMKDIEEALKLTDDQKAKMQEQKKKMKESGQETRKALRAKHDQIKAELEKPEVNKKAVIKIADEIKALENKITDERITSLLELRSVLSLEQFKKLDEFMEKRHKINKGSKKRQMKERPQQERPSKNSPEETIR